MGDTAHVDDALDAVRPQKLEEVFPCVGRMPNREDSEHFGLDLSHDEYPFSTNPWKAIKVDHPTIGTRLGMSIRAQLPLRVRSSFDIPKVALTSANQSDRTQLLGHDNVSEKALSSSASTLATRSICTLKSTSVS